MNNSTREAKWQPLEHENRPGWPAAPSRHWQASSGALYAMGGVPRYRGAVFNERHWCAENVRRQVLFYSAIICHNWDLGLPADYNHSRTHASRKKK